MESKRLSLFVVMLVIVSIATLIFAVFCSSQPLNNDAAILLWAAEQLLDGRTPYVDYVELALPAAHYVHTFPVLVSRLLELPLPLIFQGCVFILVIITAALLYIFSEQLRDATDPKCEASSQCFLASWFIFSLYVFADGGFGQREHLFILTYLPFLICRVAKHLAIQIPGELCLVAGLLLAPFALIKPHFMVLLLCSEFWLLFRSRSYASLKQIEMIAIFTVVILYLLHFAFIPSNMRHAFFTNFLPFVIQNYTVYNCSWHDLLFTSVNSLVIPLLFTALCCIVWSYRRNVPAALLCEVLGVSSIAGGVLFIVQHKGWSYHLYPALGCFTLLLATLFAMTYQDKRQLRMTAFSTWVVAALLLSTLGLGFIAFDLGKGRMLRLMPLISYLKQNSASDESILFISTNVYPAFPAILYADRRMTGRYGQMFPIPFFYSAREKVQSGVPPYRNRSNWSSEERAFLEQLGLDIQRDRPALVFIDASTCRACPPDFVVAEYLMKSGWGDEFLSAYHEVGRVERFLVFGRSS